VTTAGLHLAGVMTRGSFVAELELGVAPGEVLAVVGPNGSGKSTVLRTIAGLELLTAGTVQLGGVVLDDGAGRFVGPARRRVATVFQDHRLFPHLTARANVAFGPRARGMTAAAADLLASQWLDRLGVLDLEGRRPAQLSAGQAQRVAVARALTGDPLALVLDEPLSALDVQARGEVQRALVEHLGSFGGPSVLVTHDAVDALVLADTMVVLDGGRVVQRGTPRDVLRRPVNAFVAQLLGLNLLPGDVIGLAGDVSVAVPPSGVRLVGSPPGPASGWTGTVAAVTPLGEHLRVQVLAAPPVVAEVSALDASVRPGSRVSISIDRAVAEVYPAARSLV
jgi:molybdate transport system ATP-binding protein